MCKHMYKLFFLSIICLQGLFASAGYASSKEGILARPNPSKEVSEKKKIESSNNLLKAVSAYTLGKNDSSYLYVTKALKLNPNNAAAYFQWYKLETGYRRYEPALAAIASAYALDSSNVSYITEYASLAFETQDYVRSKKCYVQLGTIQPSNNLSNRGLLDCAFQQQDVKTALEMIKKIQDAGNYDDGIFRLHFVVLAFQNQDVADTMAVHYFKESGSHVPAIMLAKSFLRRDTSTSKFWLDKAEAIEPEDIDLLFTKADYYKIINQPNLLFLTVKQIILNQQIIPIYKITAYDYFFTEPEICKGHEEAIDSLFKQETQLADAFQFKLRYSNWQLFRNTGPDADKYLTTCLSDFENDKEQYTAVWTAIRFAQNNPDIEAILRMYSLKTKYCLSKQKWDEAIKYAKVAIELYPYNNEQYFFMGYAVSNGNNPNSAIELYNKAIEYSKKDTLIMLSSLQALGDLYAQKGDFKKAFMNYEKAIRYSMNNYTLLNNYAYYLAEQKKDLDRALSLSKITIEAQPDNITFLDTYAWILFQLNQIERSLEQYKIIMSLMKKPHRDILEHYGDVLYKSGETEFAKSFWKQAIDLGAKFNISEKER